jgi:hypothetical protein
MHAARPLCFKAPNSGLAIAPVSRPASDSHAYQLFGALGKIDHMADTQGKENALYA